jgi:hypothetical protein
VRAFIDAKHAIAHNKIMIIDGEVVLTGPSTSRRRRRRGTPRICSCCTTRTCSLTRAELAGSSGAFRSVRRALSGRGWEVNRGVGFANKPRFPYRGRRERCRLVLARQKAFPPAPGHLLARQGSLRPFPSAVGSRKAGAGPSFKR